VHSENGSYEGGFLARVSRIPIPGVGPLVATGIAAAIGNGVAFHHGDTSMRILT
jgi:hypothetical protein